MDHLDRPGNPSRDQYKIAFVCLQLAPYDGGDFLTYPSRCGFDNTGVLHGNFTHKSSVGKDEPVGITLVQSFLQSWLFFGLLCEVHKVVGRPFNQSKYVSHDSLLISPNRHGTGLIRRVDTSSLPELLSFWVESFKQKMSTGELSLEGVQQLCIRIDTYLRSAYKICYQLVQSHHTYVDEDLLLSFMCLGNAIDDAMKLVYTRCSYDFLPEPRPTQIVSPGWVPFKRRWDAPRSLLRRLLHFDWCPFDVGILKRDFGINEIIFATQLHRYGSAQRHLACSATACIANNIDEVTYKTRHGTLGNGCNESNCYDVDFQYATICEIIRSDRTPIIRSETNASGELDFSIVPHVAEEITYVAISHVWSHGTGNTKRNSLPRCQLEALYKRTAPLFNILKESDDGSIHQNIVARGLSYFWMDTICVPVQPADADLRKVAISRMAQIYEQAHAVLVLDEGLMHTSHKSKSVLSARHTGEAPSRPLVSQKDLVMFVMFSDWWRRLWTLQEGVLPDLLFVAFADYSILLGHFLDAREEERFKNLADLPSYGVQRGLWDLIYKGHLTGGERIVTIDRAIGKRNLEYRRRVLKLLCNRTTSKASDESICIATLMGLDPKVLLDTDPKDRMQMLYACLGTIPAGLVFLPVPKLETEYFRWAPRSLIGIAISLTDTQVLLSDDEDSEAEVTGSGVRLQAAGYPLVSLDTPLKNDFYIFPGPPGSIPSEEEEVRLTNIDNIKSSNEQIVAIVHYDQTVEDGFGDSRKLGVTPWTALSEQDLIDPVVILPNMRRIEIVAENTGILVTKAQLLDGVWHARFLCNVMCKRNSIAMWGDHSVSASGRIVKNRLRNERAALAQGARTGKIAWFQGSEVIREWCIS